MGSYYFPSRPESGPIGLTFRINGTVLSNQGVYSWKSDFRGQRSVSRFLVYAVAIWLNADDVVTLAATNNGAAEYQEFSGYYLGGVNNTGPPT